MHKEGSPNIHTGIFTSRFGRILRTNLTAYSFLAPAMLLVFTFGIFPIFYAFYVSLFKWRIKQGEYRGLDNYVSAMGDVAYVFFGLLALALGGVAAVAVWRALRTARSRGIPLQFLALALLPAAVSATGGALLLLRAVTLFAQAEGAQMGNAPLGLLLIALGITGAWFVDRYQHQRLAQSHFTNLPSFAIPALTTAVAGAAAVALLQFTISQLQASDHYLVALVRMRFLLYGVGGLGLGYAVWAWSLRQHSNLKLIGGLIGSIILIAAAIHLFSNWRGISAGSDPDFYLSLVVTIFFSLGTVPVQLAIAMLLATMLFQNIKAKGLFRIIFFIPYIAPAVATAGVFEAIFSIRPTSLANLPFTNGGTDPSGALRWLQEANPAVIELARAFGLELNPSWGFGPSLALFVVILYNIWVYVGYDTVIFLAGLGNIPTTLYEAAEIDGAGRWQLFRYITLPLLSPTTYFLSVVSVIGTFKAFNHIWVLREPAAQGTVDTASVYFFQTFFRGQRFGYATAMAVVLFVVILCLYIVQNRIAARKVFYG